jgi:hypothetical protein
LTSFGDAGDTEISGTVEAKDSLSSNDYNVNIMKISIQFLHHRLH